MYPNYLEWRQSILRDFMAYLRLWVQRQFFETQRELSP